MLSQIHKRNINETIFGKSEIAYRLIREESEKLQDLKSLLLAQREIIANKNEK